VIISKPGAASAVYRTWGVDLDRSGGLEPDLLRGHDPPVSLNGWAVSVSVESCCSTGSVVQKNDDPGVQRLPVGFRPNVRFRITVKGVFGGTRSVVVSPGEGSTRPDLSHVLQELRDASGYVPVAIGRRIHKSGILRSRSQRDRQSTGAPYRLRDIGKGCPDRTQGSTARRSWRLD